MVFADCDLAVYPKFLREIVDPLEDDSVGAAFGNRWFMPPDSGFGSWVRYFWNVAAVVPMDLFGIPWGGCLAIQRTTFGSCGIAKILEHTIVQDGSIKSALQQNNLKVHFVPTLMMAVPERCGLPFAFDFIKRQMTWTRLYHPSFAPVLIHAIATTMIIFTGVVLALSGIFTGNAAVASWAGGAVAIYLTAMLFLVFVLDRQVRQVLLLRDETIPTYPLQGIIKAPLAVLLTQIVYFAAILLATFRNSVVWRGVTYRWTGPRDIELVSDRPAARSEDTDSNESL